MPDNNTFTYEELLKIIKDIFTNEELDELKLRPVEGFNAPDAPRTTPRGELKLRPVEGFNMPDPRGKSLYDYLNIPKTTPTATPAPRKSLYDYLQK